MNYFSRDFSKKETNKQKLLIATVSKNSAANSQLLKLDIVVKKKLCLSVRGKFTPSKIGKKVSQFRTIFQQEVLPFSQNSFQKKLHIQIFKKKQQDIIRSDKLFSPQTYNNS